MFWVPRKPLEESELRGDTIRFLSSNSLGSGVWRIRTDKHCPGKRWTGKVQKGVRESLESGHFGEVGPTG